MLKTDVDYTYYVNIFSKGVAPRLSALEFYAGLGRAAAFLGSVLCNDLPGDAEEKVKNCLCRLTEEICQAEKRAGVKSENTDGYSVTYSEKTEGNGNLYCIVNTYLGSEGCVFAGVEM